jgi:hypothetical protein
MRWPCGPLEIERARRREGFTSREGDALREWGEPRALELLAGSPVNCLVVTWAEGAPGDGEQQRAVRPLVAAARSRGLSVVGWIAGTADLRQAAGAARAAGIEAVASDSREEVAGLDVLRFGRRGFGNRAPSDFVGDLEAVWPGVRPLKLEHGVDAMSGATQRPWVDSNAWYVRLAHALLEPKALWLAFDPPAAASFVAETAYLQAIADTEVYGARWVVSLDPHLRTGLLDRSAPALETWAGIGRGLAFFEKHRAWASYRPEGQIGVVSDFAGANEFQSFEVLNLLARQSSLYRIVEKSRAARTPLEGLDSVLYVDEAPPERELLERLHAFARAGGTLITPPGWEERGEPEDEAGIPRYRVFRHGRGRVAVAREAADDPLALAEDAQLLTSHRYDRVRVFNLGTGNFHCVTREDGRAGVLHAFAFPTPYRRGAVTAWFRRPWAEGRAWTVAAPAAAPAERTAVERGVEFHLPPVPVYCALEVSA